MRRGTEGAGGASDESHLREGLLEHPSIGTPSQFRRKGDNGHQPTTRRPPLQVRNGNGLRSRRSCPPNRLNPTAVLSRWLAPDGDCSTFGRHAVDMFTWRLGEPERTTRPTRKNTVRGVRIRYRTSALAHEPCGHQEGLQDARTRIMMENALSGGRRGNEADDAVGPPPKAEARDIKDFDKTTNRRLHQQGNATSSRTPCSGACRRTPWRTRARSRQPRGHNGSGRS